MDKGFVSADQFNVNSNSAVGITAVQAHLASVLASRSWRWTRPLRTVMSLLRKTARVLETLRNKFIRALARNTMRIRFFYIAHFTKIGIQARRLSFQFDLNSDLEHAAISFRKSLFIRKKCDSATDIRFVITQDIAFDPYLLYRFCHMWVKLGSHSTLYCDFQEQGKEVFFKGEWDFIYNRSVSLLAPIYMESASYSSLEPTKVPNVMVKLRPVSEYAKKRASALDLNIVVKKEPELNKKVSIIIPTANKVVKVDGANRWLIEDIMREIGGTRGITTQFIIVHNGDLTRQQIKKLYSLGDVKLVEYLDSQLNLSRKFNLGVEFAIYETLLLANDDIRRKSNNWITDLVKWFDIGCTGVVAPKIFYMNELLQYAGVEISTNFPNILGYRRNPLNQGYGFSFDVPRKLDAATGVLMATTKTVFNNVGGWNESLPINFNDIEYCLRVRRAGYSIIYEPNAQIFHLESASRDVSLPFERDFQHFKNLCLAYDLKSMWVNLARNSLTSSPHLGFDWFFGQMSHSLLSDTKGDS